MASLLRRSKLWDSFVPPPGFESPRTAELKFLIFFATMGRNVRWHPTEVATRVGSGNREAARSLCLKLAAGGWLYYEVCHIEERRVSDWSYTLRVIRGCQAAGGKRAVDFVTGFEASGLLRTQLKSGDLLGMFRIAKSDRRPLATRIFEYLIEHPEPILAARLRRVIRSTGAVRVFRECLVRLARQNRLIVDPMTGVAWSEASCQMTASEWLKQETKRREREEREKLKKALALRKRRRTLKKKAKKRKRPSRKGALEL